MEKKYSSTASIILLFSIVGFAGMIIMEKNKTIGIILIAIAFTGGTISYLWERSSVRYLEQGDDAFSKKDFLGANEKYMKAKNRLKFSEIDEYGNFGKEYASVSFRFALLSIANGDDIESANKNIKNAMKSSKIFRYSDFEKLANQFDVKLDKQVYKLFQDEQLETLRMWLTNEEKVDLRGSNIVISGKNPESAERDGVGYMMLKERGLFQGGLLAEMFTPNKIVINPSIEKENTEDGKIKITVLLNVYASEPSITNQTVSVEDISDERLIYLLNQQSLQNSIKKAVQGDMSRLSRYILMFMTTRQLRNDFPSVDIILRVHMPVIWRTKYYVPSGYKISIHTWDRVITSTYVSSLDFDMNSREEGKELPVTDVQIDLLKFREIS